MNGPLADLRRRTPTGVAVALVAVVSAVVALAVTMEISTYDVWGAFWIGPLLALATIPIARSAVHRSGDPQLGRIVMGAFVAKVYVGSVIRYLTVYGIYDGGGDSRRYDFEGKILAPLFRDGLYQNIGKITGTRFIELLTGQVYVFTGPTRLGGFLVFSWMGFLGLWMLYRAFEIAVPGGNHRRYLLLVLFFPTMVYWPSSIGKDAWMLLCLGFAAYGIARLLTGRLIIGVIPAALGFWGAAVVRPHIALMLVLAAVLAAILRPLAPRAMEVGGGRRLPSILAAVVLVAGVVLIMNRAEEFFSIDNLNPESAEDVFTEVTNRTDKGGSEFDAPLPTNPVGFVAAVVTVLFRPFPFEATNGLAAATSLEATALLVIVVRSYKSLKRVPGAMVRSPWVSAALVYVLGFAYAFSAIENFGILARQRAQVLPFLFVLVSLEPPRSRTDPDAGKPLDRRAAVGAAR